MLALLAMACTGTPPVSPRDTDAVDTDAATETGGPDWLDQWAFEPVDGMICGGGAPTGLAISEGTDPTELVLYLVGGGGCWDALTCFGLQTAANLEVAWGPAQMQAELALVEGSGLLDRDDPDSVFDQATWVYVPYCTGDLHVGDAVHEYDPLFNPGRLVHHAGNANLTAALDRLHTSLPDVERIWLVGGSAGGYGAQLQAHRFVETWPDAQLSVFADGSPMIQPGEYRWSLWQSAWSPSLPDGCADCGASFPAMLAARSASIPDVPFALAVDTNDPVITLFFAQPIGGLNSALSALIASQYTDSDQLSVFRETGEGHVLLGDAQNHVAADGTRLDTWFRDWALGVPLDDHP